MAQELINRLAKLCALIAAFWQEPNHQNRDLSEHPPLW
jgi:alpha-D-ribose 1-methylphosphonate 5-triphosphate synthase subunit PhnG